MMKILKTLARAAIGLLLFLAVVELACFLIVRPEKYLTGTAEILVVFQSSRNLIERSYGLAAAGLARRICIPGLSEKTLERLDKRYGLPENVKHVAAPQRTRSTFEDALQAAAIIKNQGLRDVLLVVAEHHVARSWILLKLETLGSDCRLRVAGIADKGSRSRTGLWYNEALKFWGSALEAAYYHSSGRLLTDDPTLDPFLERMKIRTLMPAGG